MIGERAFEYRNNRRERLHGPVGYVDYKSFKPWLRDDFQFCCVYCLWRETWCPDGDAWFGIDHDFSRASRPEQRGEYDNLVYSCNGCNSVKRDKSLPLDPCEDRWGNHLRDIPDGTVEAITETGQRCKSVCGINRPLLVEARRRMRQLLRELSEMRTRAANSLLRDLLSYPRELPVLSRLHPPGGNSRPEGIAASHYERRKRGELPETY